MASKLNRDNVRRNLPSATRQDLHWLLKVCRKELKRKGTRKAELLGGWQAFSNFLAGCAWAMACRASLRAAHDHPRIGKQPAGGQMWLPAELVKTVRLDVKERGWSPLTAPNFGQLRAQWAAYLQQAGKNLSVVDSPVDFEAMMAGNATESLKHVTFRVGMARGEVRRIVDVRRDAP